MECQFSSQLSFQVNNSHENTMTPNERIAIPAPMEILRIFFSFSVSPDHGFWFFPIAIPIEIPIAMPIGMPIMKSLILYTYHKQRRVDYLKIIMRKLYEIVIASRFFIY